MVSRVKEKNFISWLVQRNQPKDGAARAAKMTKKQLHALSLLTAPTFMASTQAQHNFPTHNTSSATLFLLGRRARAAATHFQSVLLARNRPRLKNKKVHVIENKATQLDHLTAFSSWNKAFLWCRPI